MKVDTGTMKRAQQDTFKNIENIEAEFRNIVSSWRRLEALLPHPKSDGAAGRVTDVKEFRDSVWVWLTGSLPEEDL